MRRGCGRRVVRLYNPLLWVLWRVKMYIFTCLLFHNFFPFNIPLYFSKKDSIQHFFSKNSTTLIQPQCRHCMLFPFVFILMEKNTMVDISLMYFRAFIKFPQKNKKKKILNEKVWRVDTNVRCLGLYQLAQATLLTFQFLKSVSLPNSKQKFQKNFPRYFYPCGLFRGAICLGSNFGPYTCDQLFTGGSTYLPPAYFFMYTVGPPEQTFWLFPCFFITAINIFLFPVRR